MLRHYASRFALKKAANLRPEESVSDAAGTAKISVDDDVRPASETVISRLLSLPAEIRIMILDYLVDTQKPLQMCVCCGNFWRQTPRHPGNLFDDEHQEHKAITEILRSSLVLSIETQSALLTQHSLVLCTHPSLGPQMSWYGFEKEMFEHWFLDGSHAKNIRHLVLQPRMLMLSERNAALPERLPFEHVFASLSGIEELTLCGLPRSVACYCKGAQKHNHHGYQYLSIPWMKRILELLCAAFTQLARLNIDDLLDELPRLWGSRWDDSEMLDRRNYGIELRRHVSDLRPDIEVRFYQSNPGPSFVDALARGVPPLAKPLGF